MAITEGQRLYMAAVGALADSYASRGDTWSRVIATRTYACYSDWNQFQNLVMSLVGDEMVTLPLALELVLEDPPAAAEGIG
jgi:hypothetical protein